MIQLSYDKDGVILQFHSRQTFLDRLLSRSSSPDIDKDQRLSFALADLRSTAEEAGDEVAVGNSEIRMTHLTMSDLSSDTADVLGLPPLVDLTLRTDVTGLIGGPDFRLFYEWLRAGRREQVRRTGAILETPSEGADGLRRIPRWMLEALDVADRFQSRADLELDVHWEALARFRRALDPGVRMVGTEIDTRIAMTDFLSGLEVTLADRFSISPRDGDQFDVVPFSSDVVEEVENSGIPISEHAAELQGGMLRTFQDRVFARGARPAYKLGPQQYLVIDPAATPVLQVMVQMQQADRDTRAAFIRNPRQVITEAVVEHLRAKGKLDGLSAAEEQEQVEQVAEPSFVETQEYSERVIGLAIYERPSIEMNGSGTTWLPESFADRVNRKIKTMGPEQIREMIARMSAAIEKGEKSIDIDGEQIPATPSMRETFEREFKLRETVPSEYEDLHNDEEESATRPQGGPVVLATKDNINDLQWIAKSRPRKRIACLTLPEVVRTGLKTHQMEGFRWQLSAWEAGLPGVLNADEQGLGKTLQAITFLAWVKKNVEQMEGKKSGPVLIVAPTTLLVNWEEEVDKHLRPPALGNVIRLYGTALGGRKKLGRQGVETQGGDSLLDLSDLREAILEGRGHRYWILTTYTTLTNYQHSLAKIPFSTAVFDEIQALKNPASLRAQAARAVNADFRIGLTGTPIENSTVDLWAIMDQITAGRLWSLSEFRERFGTPDEDNMQELYSLLFAPQEGWPSVALRRLKEEVARELPEKSRYIHPRLMPALQVHAYDEAREKLASGQKGSALKMLHHIRSVSVHPDVASLTTDEEYIAMSARLQAALQVLSKIHQQGERALVFIEHVRMQHRFIELVKHEFGLDHVDLINGSTPITRRQAIVTRFQEHLKRDSGFGVLVLGPKAAGTGLTLTAATHVIHLSRWWNPAVEEQCNDRVHRIGQTRPISVHIPMAIHPEYCDNSFDCLLHSLMTRKRKLAFSALWPMGDTNSDAEHLQGALSKEYQPSKLGDPVASAILKTFERDLSSPPDKLPDNSYRYD